MRWKTVRMGRVERGVKEHLIGACFRVPGSEVCRRAEGADAAGHCQRPGARVLETDRHGSDRGVSVFRGPQNGIGVPFGFRLKQTQKGVPPTKDTHMGVGGHQVGWDLCPPTTFDRIPSEIWLA